MKIFVLAYHRVFPGHRIDLETFDFQIRTLASKFKSMNLTEAIAAVRQPEKSGCGFVVTFDDAWADNLVYAYPILKKYGVPATIFTATNFVSEQSEIRPSLEDAWSGRVAESSLFSSRDQDIALKEFVASGYSAEFLNWAEINKMAPLVKAESHGHLHAYHFRSPKKLGVLQSEAKDRPLWLELSGIRIQPGQTIYESGSALAYPKYNPETGQSETREEFISRIREEFAKSKEIIFRQTGQESKFLAWPFGEYTEDSLMAAQAAGFEACLTIQQGILKTGDDPYRIKRFSPPRNKLAFRLAISGRLGFWIYKTLLLIFK